MNKSDGSYSGFQRVFDILGGVVGYNYCDVCNVTTAIGNNFAQHLSGRKHQTQLKRIEKFGLLKWQKREAKKNSKKIKKAAEAQQSIRKKINKKRIYQGPSRVLKEVIPVKKLDKSVNDKTAVLKKEKTDSVNTEALNRESSSAKCVQSVKTFSEVSSDGNCSSSKEVSVVLPPKDSQTENSKVSSSSSLHFNKMHPGNNFGFTPYNGRTAFPPFNAPHPQPNVYNSGMNMGFYWRHLPPPPPPSYNHRGRFQHFRGHTPRHLLPFPRAPPFSSQNRIRNQALNVECVPPQNSKDNKPEVQNSVPQASSSSDFQERHNVEKHKDRHDDRHDQSHESRLHSDSHYKSNDRHDQSHKSMLHSDSHYKSNDGRNRRDNSFNSTKPRASMDGKGKKYEMKNAVKRTEMKQSKSEKNGKQLSSTDDGLSVRYVSESKSVESANARPSKSKSGSLLAAKSPAFSNVVMKRMNARLQSFTKYGKMPTSVQIRHLALNTSPVQEKGNGKLQEWSKKINESHHDLSAQNKELINRLISYPRSRREQKKLEYYIREHARSRQKLTLPRFNLQLSGMETCKDSPSVDDSVNSMATEVVDCLPEDLLNSLISALNSDVDENVTVDFPFNMDTPLPVSSEEDENTSSANHKKTDLYENVFITVDEVGGYSSCEETPQGPEHQNSDALRSDTCRLEQESKDLSSSKDWAREHFGIANDHSYVIKATEEVSHGSSLEIFESQKVSRKRSLATDLQKSSFQVLIKKEPLGPEDKNTKATSSCTKLTDVSDSRENANLAISLSSGKPTETPVKVSSVPVRNGTSNALALATAQTSLSSYPCSISSFQCGNSKSEVKATVAKSISTKKAAPKNNECQTPLTSSDVQIKNEPIENECFLTSTDSVSLRLHPSSATTHEEEVSYPKKKPGKPINPAVEVKQEPTQQASAAAVEQNMEDTSSQTIAIGLNLQSNRAIHKTKHISGTGTEERNDSQIRQQNEKSDSIIRGYPGLSWIAKPHYEQFDRTKETTISPSLSEIAKVSSVPRSTEAAEIFTPLALRRSDHTQGVTSFCTTENQGFNDGDLTGSVAELKTVKVEPHGANDIGSTPHNEDDLTSLPRISSVTSIHNSENITGHQFSSVVKYPVVQIKQEPSSPPPEKVTEVINLCEQGPDAREEKEVNHLNTKPIETQPTESSRSTVSSPQVSSLNQGSISHGIAAAFPGVIHKVRAPTQREDPEKTPEVSSSTGAYPSDEVQPSSLIGTSHQGLSSNETVPRKLIRELLAITTSEEKLLQQAKEAEHIIDELTASLELWKRKKYDIEQKQMKLRMKRQELLISAAAQGSVPCDKSSSPSVQSVSTVNDRPSDHGDTSDEEQQSLASTPSSSTSSDENSASGSDSNWSHTVSQTRHNISNIRKRKKKKKRQHTNTHAKTTKLQLRSSTRRERNNEPRSDSPTKLSCRRASKRKIPSRSSTESNRYSTERSPCRKKRYDIKDLQIVLQPLELENNSNKKKIMVNEDDDIVVLDVTPRCSTESAENVDLCSSDEEEVETTTVRGRSSVSQANVATVSGSRRPISDPEFVADIGVLQAHSTAVIDLKVYDGYLYSCSLDWTAKRFSVVDPVNDRTYYEGHTKSVTSICLSPHKEVYTTCHDGYLRCFAASTGDSVGKFEIKSGITCSCCGGGALYLGLLSGEVIFFSYTLKKVVYELKSSICAVGQLATVTQGAQRLLCVAANDGIVSLYDTATGLLLRCLEGRLQPPCCIQICDNSVYTTTSEKSVVVHDLLSGKLERMMNWAASATGLEIIDNFILTSSYDGLVRCHNKNQVMVLHSIYYGAGKGTVMSMTSYKKWVFTGNRNGVIEAFKFDPLKQLSCEYGRCRQNFGRECDILYHVTTEHLQSMTLKTKSCPWRTCNYTFTPKTTIEGKEKHIKEHLASVY